MECNEILAWAKIHDRKEAFWIQKAKEIGNRLRDTIELDRRFFPASNKNSKRSD